MKERNTQSQPYRRCTAILLAAGSGTRMGGPVRKQYMELCGRPVLSYSLETLERCPVISDIVLVTPPGEEEFCRTMIVEPTQARVAASCRNADFKGKVRILTEGGSERCFSVRNGLRVIDWPCDFCFIHDGARAFLDEETLERLYDAALAQEEREPGAAAVVAGMPSKDTVKLTDAGHYVTATPDRSSVWLVQTPQVFAAPMIREAYEKMSRQYDALLAAGVHITDDAMVVEELLHKKVQLVEASYRNIKITTPEDLLIGEAFLRNSPRGAAASCGTER